MSIAAQAEAALIPNDGSVSERDNLPDQQAGGARTYGDFNRDLPEELQNAALSLIQEAQRQDLYQRRMEVMRDRRNRFYERGIQHIYEDIIQGIFVQGSPGAMVPDPSGTAEHLQCGQYVDDYNIFGRALQIIVAKLTENPPGVVFEPDSGNSSMDLQASQAAEAYRILYDRRNDTKELLTSIVRTMGVSGRTITWTRTTANAPEFGTDENSEPRPVQTTTVYGTLEGKVPILATSLEKCPYVLLTEDPHILIAKQKHPYFADKISEQGDEGIADTQFERLARLGALQGNTAAYQITDTYGHHVEEKFCFFRPAMFMDKSLDSQYENGTLRDAFLEAFPDGALFTFVGQTYVGSANKCMDDELALDFPYAGDGLSRKAIMDDAVVIQDRFNDDMNAYAEVKDCGWPSTWINVSQADIDTINDQTASPYAFRALKNGGPRGENFGNMFWREPDPVIPSTFVQHTEYLATQLLQFILAIPSAVQGAGMTDQKTASGYSQAIQQAMGQLGVIYGAVQRLMSNVYAQAALLASRDKSDGKPIVIPTPKGAKVLAMSNLGKGHFLCHPDTDSGYPESTMQKRATLNTLLDMAVKNPEFAGALLQSPDNWDVIARLNGLAELTFPEALSRRKQLAEIEVLAMQSPMDASPQEVEQAATVHAAQTLTARAQGVGAPPPFDPGSLPKHSSIPVGPLDYHEWEFEMCKEKLSDYAWIQEQMAAGNADGVENIFLHAMEHQKYIEQAAQAQMAPQAAAPNPPLSNQPPAPQKEAA